MTKGRKIDLALLLVYPLIGFALSFLLGANAFFSVIIFFGIPSLYLSFREKTHVRKAFIFSLFAIPIIIFVDYIAHITEAWAILHSILPYRLFGYVTLEVILWAVFHMYFLVLFYEYFINRHTVDKIWYSKTKHLVLYVSVLFFVFLTLLLVNPGLLRIPYWYLIFGVFMIFIPVLLEAFTFPKVFRKLLKVGVYFFYVTFIYEIAALKLGWWEFPGREYIGWVSFFEVRFPFEEFFFWLVLLSIGALSYYEFFFDDEK